MVPVSRTEDSQSLTCQGEGIEFPQHSCYLRLQSECQVDCRTLMHMKESSFVVGPVSCPGWLAGISAPRQPKGIFVVRVVAAWHVPGSEISIDTVVRQGSSCGVRFCHWPLQNLAVANQYQDEPMVWHSGDLLLVHASSCADDNR